MAVTILPLPVIVLSEGLLTEVLVNLNEPSTGTVTVNYAFQAGSATLTEVSTSAGTLTFAPGQTQRSFSLFVVNDTAAEPTEAFHILFSNAVGATLASSHAVALVGQSDGTPAALPGVIVDDVRGDEFNRMLEFRVRLTQPSDSPVQVGYTTRNGSALAGSDFTATSGMLSFAAGHTERSVQVPVTDDFLAEHWEHLYLDVINPVNATVARGEALGWIAPNDNPGTGTPFLSVLTDRSTEHAGLASVGVLLNHPSASNVSVEARVQITGSTLSTSDVALPPAITLNFAPGQVFQTVNVPLMVDGVMEKAESFVLRLLNPSGALIENTLTPFTVTEQYVPVGVPNLIANDAMVDESRAFAAVRVVLDKPSNDPIRVTVRAVAASATAADFASGISTELEFAPGQTEIVVYVPVTDDTLPEDDEQFRVVVEAAEGELVNLLRPSATVTIADNDAAPVAMPLMHVYSVMDADAPGGIRIVTALSDPSTQPAGFTYTLNPSGPAFGQTLSPFTGTYTFAPGQVLGEIVLPTNPTGSPEVGHSLFLQLSNPFGGLIADNRPTITIAPHDLPQPGGVRVLRVLTKVVDEAAGIIEIVVVLEGAPLTEKLEVPFRFEGSSAMGGLDYTALNDEHPIWFVPGGPNTARLQVYIDDDDVPESVEEFGLLLEPPPGVLAPARTSIFVLDNDGPDSGAQVLASIFAPVAHESDSYASAWVVLDKPSTEVVTVTVQDGAIAGSNADAFLGVPITLRLEPGALVAEARWPLDRSPNGLPAQPYTSFHAQITATINSGIGVPYGLVSIAPHGEAVDDPEVSVRASRYGEEGGYSIFDVWFKYPSDEEVSISYDYGGTARYDVDYTAPPPGELRFAPGETVKQIPVWWRSGSEDRAGEFLELRLRASIDAEIVTSSGVTFHRRITLSEDLPEEQLLLHAAAAAVEAEPVLVLMDSELVNEGDGFVELAVRLSAPAATQVSVAYATSALSNFSATPGSDYGVHTGTLRFAPGQQLQTLRFAIVDDTLAERTEGWRVTLGAVTGAQLATSFALVTITDNDSPGAGTPVLTLVPAAVNETDGVARIVARLDRPSTGPVSVAWRTADGTATAGSDYISRSSTVGFLPGQTVAFIDIPLVDDGADEGAEAFTVEATAVSGAALAHSAAAVAIVASDGLSAALPQVSLRTARGFEEDGFIELRVELDAPSANVVSVTWAMAAGSAGIADFAAGTDGVIAFAPGERLKLLRIALVDDALVENEESFSVGIANPVNGVLDPASNLVQARIVDLDGAVSATFGGGVPGTATGDVEFTLNFGLGVSGLDVGDFSVFGGSAVQLEGSGTAYTLLVRPDAGFEGRLSVVLPRERVAATGAVMNAAAGVTQVVDLRAPNVVSISPVANATAVARDANLVLNFSEAVLFGSGSVVLVAIGAAEAVEIERFDVATPGARLTLAGGGRQLTIDPSAELPAGAVVELRVDAGALRDGAGNLVAAIAGHRFTTAGNTPPVAADGTAGTAEDQPLQGQLPAASDGQGQAVTYAAAQPAPAHGVLVVNGDGSYSYTPNLNFNGTDRFGFSVADSLGASNSYVMDLTITPVNDAPAGSVAVTGTAAVFERLGFTQTLADADGLGSFTVQWLRNGAAIGGATGTTFDLSDADIGAVIAVRLSWTDGGGSAETTTSPATTAVAGLASVPGASGSSDTLTGSAANEQLAGGAGNDTLLGLAGRDRLQGDAGEDLLDGGDGDDTIDGGAGFDVVRIGGSAAITLDLQAQTAQIAPGASSSASTDRLIDIQGAIGGSAADMLAGLDNPDPAQRGETLRGAAGDDTIDGRGGVDAAEFTGPRAGYRVERNQTTGEITVTDIDTVNGDEGSDRLIGIERLVFADQMLAFGDRAEDIARLAFVLWQPAIVTGSYLFARGYSFYDNGSYSFQQAAEAALGFWDQQGRAFAELLVRNSGSTRSVDDVLALVNASGRTVALMELARDAGTTGHLVATGVREAGIVAALFVPGFGQLFDFMPG